MALTWNDQAIDLAAKGLDQIIQTQTEIAQTKRGNAVVFQTISGVTKIHRSQSDSCHEKAAKTLEFFFDYWMNSTDTAIFRSKGMIII